MSQNPFDLIIDRLEKIENKLSSPSSQEKPQEVHSINQEFRYYPILNLFEQKICSKPSFYKYLRQGRYDLYKFGGRSFVELEQFYAAFRKITFKNEKVVRSP